MKDNFSVQSKIYSKFRPIYPNELIMYLLSIAPSNNCVLDCGTGNGQLAVKLADRFKEVYAIDISSNQINNAVAKENIIYKIESCEKTRFENDKFDLITAAQALHWFNFEKFYDQVYRILKPNGTFAAIAYSLPIINSDIDNIVQSLYSDILGNYWDIERKHVDEEYKSILFPFDEIKAPLFFIELNWRIDNLIGYIKSWSAIQHYLKKNKSNQINSTFESLKAIWHDGDYKKINFKIITRIGKLKK